MDDELAEALAAHKGKWVAIDQARKSIAAVGDSAKEVYEKAVRAGVTDPLVLRVAQHADDLNLL